MNNTKYEVRPVVGYEGKYSVSNDGRVFSHDYRRTGQTKQLKPGNVNGYLYVDLFQDEKRKTHKVHRLVLEAFVPNPENKSECDHIDTNPSNNHVSNLRWVTAKENCNNPITLKNKSAGQKGRTHSEETRRKMSAAHKGKTRSEQHRKTKQGKNNPRYNTTIHTFRNKTTNEEFVGTMYDFRTTYNLNQGSVSDLIYGRIKSTKGWVLV